jgi:hypothetical protein
VYLVELRNTEAQYPSISCHRWAKTAHPCHLTLGYQPQTVLLRSVYLHCTNMFDILHKHIGGVVRQHGQNLLRT